jgi:hypothetical protein
MGHESELYALTIDDDLRDDVRPFADPAARDGQLTIFHYALPSPMTEAFASLPFGPGAAVPQRDAGGRTSRRTIRRCSALPRLVETKSRRWPGASTSRWGTRKYNRRELETLGFDRPGVFPIAGRHVARDAGLRPAGARRDASTTASVNFLFVGRIAPNKKIEDIIRLAEFYKRYVDAYYRFIFVGRFDVVPRYYSMIRALMTEYRFLNDRFLFTGPVSDRELAVYYRHAAVYISMSEHEGFCVPLVEAMAADVPVLAYAAAAVPTRWQAPASSSRRRTSNTPPNCSEHSPSTTRCAPTSLPDSAGGSPTSGDASVARELTTLVKTLS